MYMDISKERKFLKRAKNIKVNFLPILSKFCYSVYNQHESFIYLDLMVKNRKIHIERYFK
jgi:hypothetical protein